MLGALGGATVDGNLRLLGDLNMGGSRLFYDSAGNLQLNLRAGANYTVSSAAAGDLIIDNPATSDPVIAWHEAGVAKARIWWDVSDNNFIIENVETGAAAIVQVVSSTSGLWDLFVSGEAGPEHRFTAADATTTVINEQGRNIDFRIEGDSVTDVFKVDAGKDVAYFRGIGARVYNDAAITIGNSAFTTLTFNQERFDTDAIHSTSSNTGRLTATTAGVYSIGASVEWAGDPTEGGMKFFLNGTTTIAFTTIVSTDVRRWFQGGLIYKLSATEYITVQVFQGSGGDLNVNATGNYSPEFWMVKIA
jgi:hypothetical protein